MEIVCTTQPVDDYCQMGGLSTGGTANDSPMQPDLAQNVTTVSEDSDEIEIVEVRQGTNAAGKV